LLGVDTIWQRKRPDEDADQGTSFFGQDWLGGLVGTKERCKDWVLSCLHYTPLKRWRKKGVRRGGGAKIYFRSKRYFGGEGRLREHLTPVQVLGLRISRKEEGKGKRKYRPVGTKAQRASSFILFLVEGGV